MEEWRAIAGWEGLYEVSDQGRVRSLDRVIRLIDGRTRRFPSVILRQRSDKDGYQQVDISVNSAQRTRKVHQLVAEAFCEKPDGLVEPDHKNGNVADNRKENLRWRTKSMNGRNRHKAIGASGIIGVRYRADKLNPWQAYCHTVERKFKSLGHFASAAEATAARAAFQEQFK